MYYVVKKNKGDKVIVTELSDIAYQYEEVKKSVYKMYGQFGRIDYAVIWKDYYNNLITQEQLKIRLEID